VSLLVEWNKKRKTMRFETGKDYYADYDVNTFFGIANLQQRITKMSVDADLLNAAVFWFTNIERKKHNLKQFEFHNKLQQTAVLHSEQMKRHNFFDHENTFEARYKTLTDRINSVKDNSFQGFMAWGENISDYPIIKANENFTIENRNGVQRLFSANGTEILPYSYYEFAKIVVDGWMNSPGHRANILNSDYEYLGCGCANYEKQGNGHSTLYFKLTQNFGGELNKSFRLEIQGFGQRLRHFFFGNEPIKNKFMTNQKKKFIVQSTSQDTSQEGKKKFEITNEFQVTRRGRGFENAQVSRPRKCTFCGTENTLDNMTVIKSNNGFWECSACGNKWK